MPAGTFSITVDFLHGTTDGCIRVVAVPHITLYRIPHDFAQNLTSEPELKQAGIYLLVNTVAQTLYVGQADSRDNGNGILGRMLEPHTKKKEIDQWDVGYALTSGTPHFFGATELNWLERYFYDEALKAGRYELLNGNRPHASDINFSTKTILGNYTDYAFFLLKNQVGCDAFSPIAKAKPVNPTKVNQTSTTTDSTANNPRLTLYITSLKKDVDATGILQNPQGILVKAGSKISTTSNLANQKHQAGMEKRRQQLISSGIIQDRVFTVDYKFESVSTAAAVILGTSSSGNAVWKDKNGTSLGNLNAN